MYCKDCCYFEKNKLNPVLGLCRNENIGKILEKGYEHRLAIKCDTIYATFMIIVGEKFGCIHFEAIS